VVLLAAEFLKVARPFIEEGVAPATIIKAFRLAADFSLDCIQQLAVTMDRAEDREQMLMKCAATAMNSKLISDQQDFFAPMVVAAVTMLDEDSMDLDLIGIKKVTGGSVTDSVLVRGVAFQKTFSYAGNVACNFSSLMAYVRFEHAICSCLIA